MKHLLNRLARRPAWREAGYGTVEYMLILLGLIAVAGLVVMALTGKVQELIGKL